MWTRFLWAFAITSGTGLGLCLLLVLLVDPLRVSPVGVVPKTGFAIDDLRFFAPQVIANEQFDSYLVGTSTIHSVDPHWAEAAFGGRFAIVALQGGTPYELSEVVRLLGRKSGLRQVIFGLDATTWCKTQQPRRFRSDAVFPDWLYDETRLNDLTSLFNLQMVCFSLQQLEIAFGAKPAVPANGYLNHLDDTKWNAIQAKQKIYGTEGDRVAPLERNEAVEPTRAESYPALDLLRKSVLTLPSTTELVIVLMPFHASVLEVTSVERENWNHCKQRVATLVAGRRSYVIDFFIRSEWTIDDENFWDRSHFRTRIARALMGRLKEAIERGRDADDGTYKFLSGPGLQMSSPSGLKFGGTQKPAHRGFPGAND